MGENDIQELARLIRKSIFSPVVKWTMGIVGTLLVALIIGIVTTTYNNSYGTMQNTRDIQTINEQMKQKADITSLGQYLQENTTAHQDIKGELKEMRDSQIIIQQDIKELLKRK